MTIQMPAAAEPQEEPSEQAAPALEQEEEKQQQQAPTPDREATPKQRAYHAFLVRASGEALSLDHVRENSGNRITEEIRRLKKIGQKDDSFATWPQWWKLFRTLLEAKASDEEMLEVLAGLTDRRSTYSLTDEWLKKAA